MNEKRRSFRELLHSNRTEFLMEAHDGVSAKIVQEAGFAGVWASGLTISASMGLRDANEASWTQMLDRVEMMTDATDIPLMLDGDTGYGNFNNVRRLVAKLEQYGASAVCLKDKLFPKANSLITQARQPLADADEFARKIRAAKDTCSRDFCVVARIEAFIAGMGLSEAIRRADKYSEAGVDAILIHSRQTTADQVLAFKERWGGTTPVVIIPTNYHQTPTEVFEDAGFSLIVWANHLMRASVAAMQEATVSIPRQSRGL